MVDGVRIQKALADAGVASRRMADALVADGRVTVNGARAQIGQRVEPGHDRIAVDGRVIGQPTARLYLALHKPAGVTSTVSDRHASTTVLDMVPQEMRAAGRLYPVGRLDRDSEGLLLLTNDGDWAHRVLHPRYEVEREYAVGLGMELTERQAAGLRHGIELEEGIARFLGLRRASPREEASIDAIGPTAPGTHRPRLSWYLVVLAQGWKRQVRRMFAAVDAPVARLVRVRIGPVRLGTEPAGSTRALTAAERRGLEALPS